MTSRTSTFVARRSPFDAFARAATMTSSGWERSMSLCRSAECLLFALSGHSDSCNECPLSALKRIYHADMPECRLMTRNGPQACRDPGRITQHQRRSASTCDRLQLRQPAQAAIRNRVRFISRLSENQRVNATHRNRQMKYSAPPACRLAVSLRRTQRFSGRA